MENEGYYADVMALRFSPTYVGDASLAVVYSAEPGFGDDNNATYFDIMVRDLDTNQPLSYVYSQSIEVKDPTDDPGASPGSVGIVNADLELPSDFSGQSPSLRRAYISLDAAGSPSPGRHSGIYRVDDTYVYELMDTSGQGWDGRRIRSIAYYGT
jgi:hypothetical protein